MLTGPGVEQRSYVSYTHCESKLRLRGHLAKLAACISFHSYDLQGNTNALVSGDTGLKSKDRKSKIES